MGKSSRTPSRFQCHHGVPASSPLFPLNVVGTFVSMPPRRSCFGQRWNPSRLPRPSVSMPPRRSCFPPHPGRHGRPAGPFQCHHGVPASSRNVISRMRPIMFQCHHGVPASPASHPRRDASARVSMPPRRSCFIPAPLGPGWDLGAFQCHHGVPASLTSTPGTSWSSLVSMPPRRSCFAISRLVPLRIRMGFNATTAFLLRDANDSATMTATSFNATTAFLLRAFGERLSRMRCRFNATTAFLLPTTSAPRSGPHSRFNATTAFLLLYFFA